MPAGFVVGARLGIQLIPVSEVADRRLVYEDMNMPERRLANSPNEPYSLLVSEVAEVQGVLGFYVEESSHVLRELNEVEVPLLPNHHPLVVSRYA